MTFSTDFLHFFLYSFIGLFPLVNPIGTSVYFLQVTTNVPDETRNRLAYKIARNSFLTLVIVLFTGAYILKIFDITLDFVNIAGGFLIAWSAMDALSSKSQSSDTSLQVVDDIHTKLVFFPLTIPFTVGPGALAVTIALAAHLKIQINPESLGSYLGLVTGILLICLLIWICNRYAKKIFTILGKASTQAIASIFALVVLAIGFGVMWRGFEPLILTLLRAV